MRNLRRIVIPFVSVILFISLMVSVLAESYSKTIETRIVFNGQTYTNTTYISWEAEPVAPDTTHTPAMATASPTPTVTITPVATTVVPTATPTPVITTAMPTETPSPETTTVLPTDTPSPTETATVESTKYPIPEGGIEWDGTSEFLAPADFSDVDVVQAPDNDPYGDTYVKNQITFMGTDNCDFYEIQSIAAKLGCRIVGYLAPTQDFVIEYVGIADNHTMQNIVNEIKKDAMILSNTVKLRYTIQTTSNDLIPSDPWNSGKDDNYNETWNVNKPAGRNWGVEAIHAPAAWEYIDYMHQMNIGVIDSFVLDTHEDLDAENYGHIDNWNMFKEFVWDKFNMSFWHGTHVSGIFAAKHNSIGISGVFPKGRVIGISNHWNSSDNDLQDPEFWKHYSTNTDCFMEKFYILLMRQHGVKVINLSQGVNWNNYPEHLNKVRDPEKNLEEASKFTQTYSDEWGWDTFFTRLQNLGYDFILISSAGNDSINCAMNSWPVWIRNDYFKERLLVVGAFANSDDGYRFCDYSNYGAKMEILAPGDDIYSTVPAGATNPFYLGRFDDSGYYTASGTSMAAPHVAGTAAMIWSINPNLTGPEVKQMILENADYAHSLSSGHDDDWITQNTTGGTVRIPRKYPLLDAGKAVVAAVQSMGLPTATPIVVPVDPETTDTPEPTATATITITAEPTATHTLTPSPTPQVTASSNELRCRVWQYQLDGFWQITLLLENYKNGVEFFEFALENPTGIFSFNSEERMKTENHVYFSSTEGIQRVGKNQYGIQLATRRLSPESVITIKAKDGAGQVLNDTITIVPATEFDEWVTHDPNAATPAPTSELDITGTIHARIEFDDGSSYNNINFKLYHVTGDYYAHQGVTTMNELRISTASLSPGQYQLTISKGGYASATFEFSLTSSGETVDLGTVVLKKISDPVSTPDERDGLVCAVTITQDSNRAGMLFFLQLKNVQGSVTQFDVTLTNKGIIIVDTLDGIYDDSYGFSRTDDSWGFYADDELINGAILSVTASDSFGQIFHGEKIIAAGGEFEGLMPSDD